MTEGARAQGTPASATPDAAPRASVVAPLAPAAPTPAPPAVAGWLACFLAQAERRPEAVALEVKEGSITYGELVVRIERARAGLEEAGLTPGDTVLLLLRSGTDLLVAFYAAASLGVLAVPLAPEMTPYELAPMFEVCDPIAVVTTSRAIFRHADTLAEVRGLRTALLADVDPDPAAERVLTQARAEARDGVRADRGADRRADRGAPSDSADLQPRTGPIVVRPLASERRRPLSEPEAGALVGCHFTYKGLGYPLGALHRYGDYALASHALNAQFPVEPGASHLATLPLHAVYGLTGTVIGPLAGGASLRLLRRLNPERLLDLLAREQVQVACLVPVLLRVLVAAARRHPERVRALHPELVLTSGGSHLNGRLAAAVLEALGREPLQGYGLTETLPVTANTPRDARRGSLGRPLAPWIRIAVRDAFGRDAPPGVAGEVHIAGPTVTPGFLKRPRETARFLRDGWLRTGDLGWLEPDGHLYYLGRREAFTKVKGKMVDLVEVERALSAHPAVIDARAYAVPGRSGEDELACAVTLSGRGGVRLGELLALARERLSRHKVPQRIKVYRAQYRADAAEH